MVKIGQKVEFTPFVDTPSNYTPWIKPVPLVGTVIHVNKQNEVFTAQYTVNGVKLREGFKFADIGKAVHLIE